MKRIVQFDFVRVICTLSIVLCHYSETVSGGWCFDDLLGHYIGRLDVVAFFVLSGVLIYQNNAKIDLEKYFTKRWLSVYPSFYTAWLLWCGFFTFLHGGYIFYGVRPWTFILTILGLDGYTLSKISNFYLLGEWFLGAIIIIYCIYPICLYLFNVNRKFFLIACITLYILTYRCSLFSASPFTNIFSCLLPFVIGMDFTEKCFLRNRKFIGILFLYFILLLLFPWYKDTKLMSLLLGIGWFTFLYFMGTILLDKHFPWSTRGGYALQKLSSISYEIFLVQHLTIGRVFVWMNPITSLEKVIGAVIVITASVVEAYFIHSLSKIIVRFGTTYW